MITITVAIIEIVVGVMAARKLLRDRTEWNRITAGIVTVMSAVIFGAGGYLMGLYGYHWLKMLRYFTLMYALLILAVIDVREKIIPNRALMILFGFRLLLLLGEIWSFPELAIEIVLSSVAGMIGGGLLFLIAGLLTGKGLGMGDVKLIGVIGFYLGFRVLMSNLVITLTLTVVAGIGLLLFKKISMKSEIPFAPFAAVGTIITLLMGF